MKYTNRGSIIYENGEELTTVDIVDILNSLDLQLHEDKDLIRRYLDVREELRICKKENEYWKNKAMTLLMQIRTLLPRMTDAEVKKFNEELEKR